MKKAYKFELTVEPKNLTKANKLFENNKDLFVRVLWAETKVKVV